MSHADEIEAIASATGRSPLDVLEFFLERSAIREFDGGMSREAAESEAVGDCMGHFAPSRPSLATLARATSAQDTGGGDCAAQSESFNHGAPIAFGGAS